MMAKKHQQAWNLFEPMQAEAAAPPAEPQAVELPKIKDPCPRCGGRSLKTKRAFEHGGATHYCATACLSEDRMDNFYFTPKPESFQEQAEREEAKKIVASEQPLTGQEQVAKAFEEIEEVIATHPEIQELDSNV